MDIELRILGIPAMVCDIETYRGEIDHYVICDRTGRPAPWLERKLYRVDEMEIEDTIWAELDRRYDEERALVQYDRLVEKFNGHRPPL